MFLVRLQRAQPDQARYQQKRVSPTNVSHTPRLLAPTGIVSAPGYHGVSVVRREPTSPGAESVADRLVVRGAREHNLKDVSLDLPRDSLIVFTGLSGSGKSSLAFDTLYAEGQRRYVESLSAYARQFLERMEKPDVDDI